MLAAILHSYGVNNINIEWEYNTFLTKHNKNFHSTNIKSPEANKFQKLFHLECLSPISTLETSFPYKTFI